MASAGEAPPPTELHRESQSTGFSSRAVTHSYCTAGAAAARHPLVHEHAAVAAVAVAGIAVVVIVVFVCVVVLVVVPVAVVVVAVVVIVVVVFLLLNSYPFYIDYCCCYFYVVFVTCKRFVGKFLRQHRC